MTLHTRLDGVTYAYPDTTRYTLDDVSWAMAGSETWLVLGPSGAGKSTLLRTFNGLVPHFTGGRFGGAVTVAGHAAHLLGPRAMSAHVGMLFQDPETASVAPNVADDVAFALEQIGIARGEMHRRVADALAAVGIAHLAGRDLSTLSGGERQRAALAAALVRAPGLLVLDEPTSQLDPDGARAVLDAVAVVQRTHGMGVVLAEHRLERVVAGTTGAAFLPGDGTLVAGKTRTQLRRLADSPQAGVGWLPPVVALALARGWEPLPLTVAAARPFVLADCPRCPAALPVPVPHPAGIPLIEAQEVSVTHGTVTTLQRVDLAVHAGEIVALIGANGAGKTTLLRALLGTQPVAAGRVVVGGRDVTAAGIHARLAVMPLGYVPQQPGSLLFAETVEDEIALTRTAHAARGTRGTRTLPPRFGDLTGLLAAFGLAGMASRYPRDLSVGERARLALAVTLAADPPLVLLDEPTRGLDPGAKAALGTLLRELRDEGRGVLLVTHDVELVAHTADRVARLEDGRIVAMGHPRAVLPGTPFAPQIAQLTNGAFLTLADVLATGPAVRSRGECQ